MDRNHWVISVFWGVFFCFAFLFLLLWKCNKHSLACFLVDRDKFLQGTWLWVELLGCRICTWTARQFQSSWTTWLIFPFMSFNIQKVVCVFITHFSLWFVLLLWYLRNPPSFWGYYKYLLLKWSKFYFTSTIYCVYYKIEIHFSHIYNWTVFL